MVRISMGLPIKPRNGNNFRGDAPMVFDGISSKEIVHSPSEISELQLEVGDKETNRFNFSNPFNSQVQYRTLFIKIHYVKYSISCRELDMLFSRFGILENTEILGPENEFHSKICFQNKESALEAFNSFNGRNIYDGCCRMELFLMSNLGRELTEFKILESSSFSNHGERGISKETESSCDGSVNEFSLKMSEIADSRQATGESKVVVPVIVEDPKELMVFEVEPNEIGKSVDISILSFETKVAHKMFDGMLEKMFDGMLEKETLLIESFVELMEHVPKTLLVSDVNMLVEELSNLVARQVFGDISKPVSIVESKLLVELRKGEVLPSIDVTDLVTHVSLVEEQGELEVLKQDSITLPFDRGRRLAFNEKCYYHDLVNGKQLVFKLGGVFVVFDPGGVFAEFVARLALISSGDDVAMKVKAVKQRMQWDPGG